MKKFGFFLFAVLGLIACGDDNNDPTPEQHVTCSISAPAEGATVNIAAKIDNKGNEEITIKRFFKENDSIKLISENINYPTIEREKISIIGKVVGLIRLRI